MASNNPFAPKPKVESSKSNGLFVPSRNSCRIPFKAVALKLFKSITTPNIRSLEIDCDGLSDVDLNTLVEFLMKAGAKYLVKLKLINFHRFDLFPSTLPGVEHLDLEKCTIDPSIALKSIFPNLISLELQKSDTNLETLRDLSKLKILEALQQPQSFFTIPSKKAVSIPSVKLLHILLDKPIDFDANTPFYLMNMEINWFNSTETLVPDERNKNLVKLTSMKKKDMTKLILNLPDTFSIKELTELAEGKPKLTEIRGIIPDISTDSGKSAKDELVEFYDKFPNVDIEFKKSSVFD